MGLIDTSIQWRRPGSAPVTLATGKELDCGGRSGPSYPGTPVRLPRHGRRQAGGGPRSARQEQMSTRRWWSSTGTGRGARGIAAPRAPTRPVCCGRAGVAHLGGPRLLYWGAKRARRRTVELVRGRSVGEGGPRSVQPARALHLEPGRFGDPLRRTTRRDTRQVGDRSPFGPARYGRGDRYPLRLAPVVADSMPWPSSSTHPACRCPAPTACCSATCP